MCDIFIPTEEIKHMKESLKVITEIIKKSNDFDMDLEAIEDEQETEHLEELDQESAEHQALLRDSKFHR